MMVRVNDIMDLLNLFDIDVLSVRRQTLQTVIRYSGWCALQFLLVAEIVMQNSEEQALATYSRTIPPWLRYVDG